MLQIIIPAEEYFDEGKCEFITSEAVILELEHSLAAMSKWESKWEKPFLATEKTREQILDYVRMMILGALPSEKDFSRLSEENLKAITRYIDSKQTATWINQRKTGGPYEVVTAEIIYYWMISQGIWLECENWHIMRLLTLIQVCNIKNAPKKKTGNTRQAAADRRALNELRRQQYGTTG